MITAKDKFLLFKKKRIAHVKKVKNIHEMIQFFERNLICASNKMPVACFHGPYIKKKRKKWYKRWSIFETFFVGKIFEEYNSNLDKKWLDVTMFSFDGLPFKNSNEFKQFLQDKILNQSSLVFEIRVFNTFFFLGSKLDCLNILELGKLNSGFFVSIYFSPE